MIIAPVRKSKLQWKYAGNRLNWNDPKVILLMSKTSFFTKLILFGCFLAVIPVLALGWFSYMKSSGAILRQVHSGNMQMIRQLNSNVEQVLKTLDYTLNNVASSSIMQEALYQPMTAYEFQLYNKLRKEMSYLQSPETKVSDIILLNFADNWIVSNRGLYALDSFQEKDRLLGFLSLPYSTSWTLQENAGFGSPETEASACPYTITLIKKLPIMSSQKRGMAFAFIPACKLADELRAPSGSTDMMVIGQDGRIVLHSDPSYIGKPLAEAGYLQAEDMDRLAEKSGQFDTRAGSEPVNVTFLRSDWNGWTYVSVTDIGQITKESRSVGWFTFYACLAIIALSVGFVWLGSRNMYTPIRGIVKAISDRLPEIKVKKQNEILVIRDHIQNLFESNSSLRQELHRNTEQMRTFFLIKLYQGHVHAAELEEKLRLYGYAPHAGEWNRLTVLTLTIDQLEQTRFESKDLDLLLFAINNIVEELVPAEHRLSPVIVDQTQVTLIGRAGLTAEQYDDYIYRLTESIQREIRRYLDLHVSIGISLPFDKPIKAPRAYREGLEALKHRLKLGKGVIIPYANLNAGKHKVIMSFPKQIENELLDSIRLADEEKCNELLRQWLNEVLREDRSPQEYQIALMRLLNQLMVAMQEAGIRVGQIGGEAESRSVYEELLQLYVKDEIESWFKTRILKPLLQMYRDRRDSQYHNLSERIIEMIESGYDSDLTLEECASRLHYNVYYLSSVFKKETNMSFSDYLSMYRFHMAKKWLTETDMPVKDIAERLQYTNPQNFIRSFRKQEGMTPGQYRSRWSVRSGPTS